MGHQVPSGLITKYRYKILCGEVTEQAREVSIIRGAVIAVDEKTIMEYIESQKWDQDDQGFKTTAPEEP